MVPALRRDDGIGNMEFVERTECQDMSLAILNNLSFYISTVFMRHRRLIRCDKIHQIWQKGIDLITPP